MIEPITDLIGLEWVSELQGSPGFYWTIEELKELLLNHEFWVFRVKGAPVAFAACLHQPVATELTVLATHPDFRGQGLMRKLINKIVSSSRQDIEIWLEVHNDNLPAKALYEALNFAVVGSRPRYYRDGGTALLMSLRI